MDPDADTIQSRRCATVGAAGNTADPAVIAASSGPNDGYRRPKRREAAARVAGDNKARHGGESKLVDDRHRRCSKPEQRRRRHSAVPVRRKMSRQQAGGDGGSLFVRPNVVAVSPASPRSFASAYRPAKGGCSSLNARRTNLGAMPPLRSAARMPARSGSGAASFRQRRVYRGRGLLPLCCEPFQSPAAPRRLVRGVATGVRPTLRPSPLTSPTQPPG